MPGRTTKPEIPIGSAPAERPATAQQRPACGPRPIRRHRVSIHSSEIGSSPLDSTTSTPQNLEETTTDRPVRTFADFGVRTDVVDALARVGITSPFPIQAMTLPVALEGHDIIGQAKTGTGKTLGFGLPLLQRTVAPGEPGFDELDAPGKPQALVV